jgi:hypothetical protein
VGIPYNRDLISLHEISMIGAMIWDEIDPSVQVCVLNYRPESRSKVSRPGYEDRITPGAIPPMAQHRGRSCVAKTSTTAVFQPSLVSSL